MKRITKLFSLAVLALSLTAFSQAQTTTITASHLELGAFPISTGIVTFTPVSTNGLAIAFSDGTGAQHGPTAFACQVTAGAITGAITETGTTSGTCQVPDSTETTPANILYTAQVCDQSLGLRTSGQCYTLQNIVGISGTTWALDHYGPPAPTSNVATLQAAQGTTVPTSCVAPSVFTLVNGSGSFLGFYTCVGGAEVAINSGGVGATGATGATGPAGTAATVAVGSTTTLAAGSAATVTNSGTASAAILNFGIPQGAAGSGGGASSFSALTGTATPAQLPAATSSAQGAVELPTGQSSNVLGSAAFTSSTAYDAFGAATAAITAAETYSANGSNITSGTVSTARLPGSGSTTVNGQTCTLGGTCTIAGNRDTRPNTVYVTPKLPSPLTLAAGGSQTAFTSTATFVGNISGTVLTVASITSGSGQILVGQTLAGTGVSSGTTITSAGTGTGGVGTYNVSISQTVTGSPTITGNSPGTITQIHITMGATGSDTPNMIQNSKLNIACDGNLVSIPFGMFFAAMDAPQAYSGNDYLNVPVMGATFTGNSNGAMVFNRRVWINYYTNCTITVVNASVSASANFFTDITFRNGTPVQPAGAPTSRAYWNAFPNYIAGVVPNTGSQNYPQVYLMPSTTFSGGGEVEAINYFVNSAAGNGYLESGPVAITDGLLSAQSGGGEDWGRTGYYGNNCLSDYISSSAFFMCGTFLQDKQGANDSLAYRLFTTNTSDNMIFKSTLAVSSANGDSGYSSSPSINMYGLTSYWTANPTTSVVQYSIPGGTYTNGQTLSLSSYPTGSYICYATGTTVPAPNGSGGCTTGTLYSTAYTIPNSTTTTVNAVAADTGFNNSPMASNIYTLSAPASYTFKSYVQATTGATSATTITSASITLAAGDFVFVNCQNGASTASWTLTNSGSNTSAGLTLNSTSTGSMRGFYVLATNAGATTFTCTSNVASSYTGVIVMDYSTSGGTPTYMAGTDFGSTTACSASTSTCTSPAVNIASGALAIACYYVPANASWTAGSIGGTAATLRANGTGGAYTSTNPVCEDATLSGAVSGATTSITTASAYSGWIVLGGAFH